jgi:transposase
MAMGTRKQREKQEGLWIAHTELATAPGHPFYQKLNELLEAERFDEFVEQRCAKFYAPQYGRPSLTPGIYFRSLLIGYFEGIGAERGIAWRLADSLALRRFVGIALDEDTPDHSTISRTRRLIDLDTHRAVFGWVLGVLADRGLLKGQRIAIDATTLEANAAMRSIMRRDSGESYEEFLRGLAKASGIAMPSREELARLDRKRKKRTSNKDWKSPADEDARVAKMKDGRAHLAHKAEHAVDLDSGAVVAVTLQGADKGDTTTLDPTLCEAGMAVAEQIGREAELRPGDKPKVNVAGLEELVTDKGYHSGAVVKRVKSYEVRSYIPEKQQKGKRNWAGKQAEQQAVYANRRRVRGEYGKSLLRRRGEFVERSFAHCYETGGMRRCHLRGRDNILKRQLVHVGAFNLSLILRQLLGAGTTGRPLSVNSGGSSFTMAFIVSMLDSPLKARRPSRSEIATLGMDSNTPKSSSRLPPSPKKRRRRDLLVRYFPREKARHERLCTQFRKFQPEVSGHRHRSGSYPAASGSTRLPRRGGTHRWGGDCHVPEGRRRKTQVHSTSARHFGGAGLLGSLHCLRQIGSR